MRVLIKFSGERIPIKDDAKKLEYLHMFLKSVQMLMNNGHEVCIVIGGGNIYRGKSNLITRVVGDRVGILSTVINSLILSELATHQGISNTVLSSMVMPQICNTFNIYRARKEIKNQLLIFAGGTGSALVTTDTASVTRAIEMECEMVIKLTQVDGIYSANPKTSDNAQRYNSIRYKDAIKQKLQFMDVTALEIAQKNQLIMRIGELTQSEKLEKVISTDVESSIENFTTIY